MAIKKSDVKDAVKDSGTTHSQRGGKTSSEISSSFRQKFGSKTVSKREAKEFFKEEVGMKKSGVKSMMGALEGKPEIEKEVEQDVVEKPDTPKATKTKGPKWIEKVGHSSEKARDPKADFGQAIKSDVRIKQAQMMGMKNKQNKQPQSDVEPANMTQSVKQAQEDTTQEDIHRKGANKQLSKLDEKERKDEKDVGKMIDDVFQK